MFFKTVYKIHPWTIYLLPLALVSGPFLSDLFCSLSGIFFLIAIYKKKQFKYINNFYFYIFITWCFYLIVRSIYSSNPYLSLESSLFYFRYGLFALSIWYLSENLKIFYKKFLIILLITITFVCVDSYLQYFTQYNLLNYQYVGNRLSGPFGDEYILGSYLARIIPLLLALYYLFRNNSKYFKYSIFTIFFISTLLIFISGERVAFFNIILFLFCTAFFLKSIRKFSLFISILIFSSLIIISNYSPQVKSRMFDKTLSQIGLGSGEINIFSIQYEKHFTSAYNIFLDNKIFGIGTKLFRERCSSEKYIQFDGCSTHPHNNLLQLLAETGIIGAFPYILFYSFLALRLIKLTLYNSNSDNKLTYNAEVIIIIALLTSLLPIIPSQNFFGNWISILYYLPIGFLISFLNKVEEYEK